jgi:cysteine desulfurase/selenocysteine lyase
MLVFLVLCFSGGAAIRWKSFQPLSMSTLTGTDFKFPEFGSLSREDFPILSINSHHGKKLIYLDSAASSQKPTDVIEKMNFYYQNSHANVHRGAHALAVKATTLYEWARDQVRSFLCAKSREEIIFTRGATEALNLVALSWSSKLKPGDEIILSVMEHHSNLVPWQMAAQRTGAILKFVNLTETMEFDYNHFLELLTSKTKIVSVAHSSNVLGNINPVKDIIQKAHEYGAIVVIDACQSLPHMPVNVQELDVDFLVASSHKMCGPTGIGFLYGKLNHLKSMPPVFGGGEMINHVDLQYSTYAEPPSKFEAGNICLFMY